MFALDLRLRASSIITCMDPQASLSTYSVCVCVCVVCVCVCVCVHARARGGSSQPARDLLEVIREAIKHGDHQLLLVTEVHQAPHHILRPLKAVIHTRQRVVGQTYIHDLERNGLLDTSRRLPRLQLCRLHHNISICDVVRW